MLKLTKTALLIPVIAALISPSTLVAKNESLDKARDAARHQEWDLVAQLAQQAVNEDPNNEAAWALLGDAQMANSDTTAAIISYEKSLQLDAKLPSAVLALTMFYLEQNRLDDADRIVIAAEEKDKKGKFDEIKVARGQIHAARGDMAEATRILMSATQKNPKNPLYPQILARIYENKHVLDLAEKYYADAWVLAPGDPVLAYEYALVLQDLRKYDDALKLFKEVQEKDPNNRNVDYMIGRLYFAARRWAEAATQFEKACEKRPEHFLSHYLLGRSYFEFSKTEKKNFYSQAEDALRQAHQLKPERKDATSLLAEVLATQGKLYYQRALTDTTAARGMLLDSSIAFSHEALIFDSGAAGALGQIGRAWDKKGNLDSAVFYTVLQVKAAPDDQTEFARLVNVHQRKKNDQALVDLLKPRYENLDWTAVKAAGDTTAGPQEQFIERYAGVYANSLIETGKSSQARDALNSLLKYKPDWCDGHALNAYIDLRRQNYEGAIPVLQAAVRACPRNADLWVSLGDSWYFANPKKRDNIAKAKEAYIQACNLGSDDGCNKFRQLSQ